MPKHLKFKDPEKRRAYRNRQRKMNYARGNFKTGKRKRHYFTDQECAWVFYKKYSDIKLAMMLGTSIQSIQVKRNELKKKGYE